MDFTLVMPAAGIGKRVGADIPKQYLRILDKAIIEHSLLPFLNHPEIQQVVVSLADNDLWFKELAVAQHPKLITVKGGKERVDSVLSALKVIDDSNYVLVHDAARPCIQRDDIDNLLNFAKQHQQGVMLACPVRDTMKRGDAAQQVVHTVDRDNLWHALTPQLFENKQLIDAILSNSKQHQITDEASAIESAGGKVHLLQGRADNIKVTQPEDLLLAEFYLSKLQQKEK